MSSKLQKKQYEKFYDWQEKAENDLECERFHLLQKFCSFFEILPKHILFLLWFFSNFDSLLGKEWNHKPLESISFSCKECQNKIWAQKSNLEQKQLHCHLGRYILKSFEHMGMFKTYQNVKKQVWFCPAMLLIVSYPILQTVWHF